MKISFGGTENASTGCLIEISTPQITGIRFTAVKPHSSRNSGSLGAHPLAHQNAPRSRR